MIRFFCDRCGRSSKYPLEYVVDVHRVKSNGNSDLYNKKMLCADCAYFILTEIDAQNLKGAINDEHKTN